MAKPIDRRNFFAEVSGILGATVALSGKELPVTAPVVTPATPVPEKIPLPKQNRKYGHVVITSEALKDYGVTGDDGTRLTRVYLQHPERGQYAVMGYSASTRYIFHASDIGKTVTISYSEGFVGKKLYGPMSFPVAVVNTKPIHNIPCRIEKWRPANIASAPCAKGSS